MNNNLFVYSGDCRLCEVGLETELVDINGQQLHTGDVVVVFTEDYISNRATVVVSSQYQTYQVFEYSGEKTVHRKSNVHKPFIMGLASVDWSNSENRWGALRIKKYTELIEGERWGIFSIRSDRDGSEVEEEVLGGMNKRDLKTDLEAIRKGTTLFGDPNPGVNTQYELYEVAEHAIERALKAEALAQKLLNVLGRVIPRYLAGRLELDLDSVLEANGLLKKDKEALGDDKVHVGRQSMGAKDY